MRIATSLFTVLFLASGVAFGQDRLGVQDSFWRKPTDTLLLDALGQVYALTAEQEFLKLRSSNEIGLAVGDQAERQQKARYRNVRLGEISQVDLTNPLRPLLFYGDAQTVVYLQRNLGVLREISLLDLGLGAIDAVAYAPNEGLWLFAPDRQELLLLDRNGNVIAKSNELSRVFRKAIRANELVATAQQVSLATDDGRILLFGPFGAYRTQLLLEGRQLIAWEDNLFFREGDRWSHYAGKEGVRDVQLTGVSDRQLISLLGELTLWKNGSTWWLERS